MQVILLEKVRNLGDLGETVNVKAGYSRNYLIPQGKAVFASEANKCVFESRREELEEKAASRVKEANARLKKLEVLSLCLDVLSSDEGKLYGSIGPNEIVKAILSEGVTLEKHEVVMPLGPIREVGEHLIEIQLHSDVVYSMSVQVGNPESLKKDSEEDAEEE
jgi:large subunit ribosomal protein L9